MPDECLPRVGGASHWPARICPKWFSEGQRPKASLAGPAAYLIGAGEASSNLPKVGVVHENTASAGVCENIIPLCLIRT